MAAWSIDIEASGRLQVGVHQALSRAARSNGEGMLICQWHLDIVYGKQGDAVRIMRAWGADKFSSSEFRRARGARLLVGFVGPSASHIVDEYTFDSLADFETALASMAAPQFRRHSEELAPYIIPGSQHWVVYRVLE